MSNTFDELKQISQDNELILDVQKKELSHWGDDPLPHQRAAVQSCELYVISKQPLLGLSQGQQDYLDHFMSVIERI